MGDEKSSMVMANRDRDRELLIPVGDSGDEGASSKPSPSSSSSVHHAGREVMIPSSSILGFQLFTLRLLCFFLACVGLGNLAGASLTLIGTACRDYMNWNPFFSYH